MAWRRRSPPGRGPATGHCSRCSASTTPCPASATRCGHNIIAAAGLGAGLAAAAVADELGGRLLVLGTPAEEGGGGKVFLIEAGAFDEVDAAVMVHPAGADLRRMTPSPSQQYLVRYTGAAAHAAAAPRTWAATPSTPRCSAT